MIHLLAAVRDLNTSHISKLFLCAAGLCWEVNLTAPTLVLTQYDVKCMNQCILFICCPLPVVRHSLFSYGQVRWSISFFFS